MSSSGFAARAQSAGDHNDQSNGRGEVEQNAASGVKTTQQKQ
jgi:hypothetical protein